MALIGMTGAPGNTDVGGIADVAALMLTDPGPITFRRCLRAPGDA